MTSLASLINLTNWGRLALLATLIAAFSLLIACSSGSDSADEVAAPATEVVAAPATEVVAAPATEVDDALAEVSRILAPEKSFTFDDYVAAGWKKSKQYGTETVPQATDIWYGFFNAKDIEVRFYESHEIAKTAGFENAADAIDQSFREGGQYGASNRGAGSSAVTKYKAFAVVGNTVMLCEQSVESCIALADVLGN